jgi:hypothetical protein
MKTTFFKEANGNDSSARLIFIIGSLWNMAVSTYLLVIGTTPAIVLAFFSGVEAVLIGLKLGQKPMESKEESKEDKITGL